MAEDATHFRINVFDHAFVIDFQKPFIGGYEQIPYLFFSLLKVFIKQGVFQRNRCLGCNMLKNLYSVGV